MLKPITLEVDGIKCQISPLPLQIALKLDKKLLTLVAPLVGAVSGQDLSSSAEKFLEKVPDILGNLSDSEFQEIINLSLMHTVVIRDGFAPIGLDDPQNREVFSGKLISLYKLLFETWRFNKLTVFQVVAKPTGDLT